MLLRFFFFCLFWIPFFTVLSQLFCKCSMFSSSDEDCLTIAENSWSLREMTLVVVDSTLSMFM